MTFDYSFFRVPCECSDIGRVGFFTTKRFMSLPAQTRYKIAFTLALSHQNGRGNFSIRRSADVNPHPLTGEGRVRVLCLRNTVFSKEGRRT